MSRSKDRRVFLKTAGSAFGVAMLGSRLPLASVPAALKMQEFVNQRLLQEHPRLHLRREQWSGLREAIPRDELLSRWYVQLQAVADTMLRQPVAQYKLIGPRLLTQSRGALQRIQTLAGLYRLDGDSRKADRARAELRAICTFPSWHPPHFLDVAEMTNAAALGYDWLYDVLPEDERQMIRNRIIEFGLRPGLSQYESGVNWSQPGANNWGQVCAGGLTMGALAIANDGAGEPGGVAPEAAAILEWTTTKVRNALTAYAPDGGWPEGPGYWLYATHYTCAMISGLQSSLGTDFGLSEVPGFADTGAFRIASIGPTGKPFNYSDAPVNLEPAPEMFWLARRFGKPIYAVDERSQIGRTRPQIFHVLWSPRNITQLQAPSPPLDATFSRIDLAFFRSSWNEKDGFFVGFKGGDNKASHGHLDLGTFVLDALGERWALDLGPDDYDLPGYFGANRWDYYRLRSEGHNVLTEGTANQVVTAQAVMRDFVSTAASGRAVIDLTAAYSPAFRKVERQIELERSPRLRVILTDTIECGSEQNIRWNMHTRANIKLSANQAVLEINGKRLRASIESSEPANFGVISANPPLPQGQQPDVNDLIINQKVKAGSTLIRVVFEVV